MLQNKDGGDGEIATKYLEFNISIPSLFLYGIEEFKKEISEKSDKGKRSNIFVFILGDKETFSKVIYIYIGVPVFYCYDKHLEHFFFLLLLFKYLLMCSIYTTGI